MKIDWSSILGQTDFECFDKYVELSELITKNITGCKQNEEKILTFELAGANIIIEKVLPIDG